MQQLSYTLLSLKQAISIIDELIIKRNSGKVKSGVFTRAELARALDYSETSGHASSIISGLVAYGVIERNNEDYDIASHLKMLGRMERDKEEAYHLRKKTFLNIPLFKELYTNFDGKPLSVFDESLLRSYGIPVSAVQKVMRAYNDSVEFLGESRPNKNPEKSEVSDESNKKTAMYSTLLERGDNVVIRRLNGEEFSLPKPIVIGLIFEYLRKNLS